MGGREMSCCCCTLRTGCLIIGYTFAVLCGIGAGYCIFGGLALEYSMSEDVHPIERVIPRAFLIGGTVLLKGLAINCLFLVGVHKGRPSFILPWIITSCAAIVVQYASFVQIAFMFGAYGTLANWVGASCGILLAFAFHVYLIMVVISYYHSIKKRSLIDEEEIMM